MPQLVRAGLRYNRWLETAGLESLELPADVITDLRTTGNALSVFEVTDVVTAERIAIGVAAGRGDPGETAYAVFDRAAVEGLGIVLERKRGNTIDEVANGVHFDLRVGTVGKLAELARVIASGRLEPIPKKRVVELLRAGFEKGDLDYAKNRLLANKLQANIPAPPGSIPAGDEQ